jgi:hypothetical protein
VVGFGGEEGRTMMRGETSRRLLLSAGRRCCHPSERALPPPPPRHAHPPSPPKKQNKQGILSGTLSFIFNTFRPGMAFSSVVAQARELGYTEPDPREDLSGVSGGGGVFGLVGADADMLMGWGGLRQGPRSPFGTERGSNPCYSKDAVALTPPPQPTPQPTPHPAAEPPLNRQTPQAWTWRARWSSSRAAAASRRSWTPSPSTAWCRRR